MWEGLVVSVPVFVPSGRHSAAHPAMAEARDEDD